MPIKRYNKEAPKQPDECSGGLVVIDSTHRMIHEGGMYSITVWDLAVVDTGTLSIGMTIPAGIVVHFKEVQATGYGWPFKMTALLYESFTPSGTYKIPNNHCVLPNFQPSLCTVNINPTGWTPSDQFGILFGGGTSIAGTGSSGASSFTSDYIVGAGTHVLVGENISGATAEIMLRMTWIEVEAS